MRPDAKYPPLELTQARLWEVLAFDRSAGVFTRRELLPSMKKGVPLGGLANQGYRAIGIDGNQYLASRLAWLYVYGEWPSRQIRFGDGNKDNCAIVNLSLKPVYVRGSRAEEQRRNRNADKERYRAYDLKRDFGINMAEYQRKFAAQDGACACCRCSETETRAGQVKWLAVDHDHETGAIRDLLCGACNKMLGLAKDNPDILEAAAAYLRRHAAETPDNVVRLSTKRNSA